LLPLDLRSYLRKLRDMVFRKPNVLLPIELSILEAGILLVREGAPEFHGYAIATVIRDQEEGRRLTAHGTLYRALDRMEKAGLLTSRIEDPEVAASENRPRRRLYVVSAQGRKAAEAALVEQRTTTVATRKGLEPR
jgi:DNA-binding PadR family transcriptional regulator